MYPTFKLKKVSRYRIRIKMFINAYSRPVTSLNSHGGHYNFLGGHKKCPQFHKILCFLTVFQYNFDLSVKKGPKYDNFEFRLHTVLFNSFYYIGIHCGEDFPVSYKDFFIQILFFKALRNSKLFFLVSRSVIFFYDALSFEISVRPKLLISKKIFFIRVKWIRYI